MSSERQLNNTNNPWWGEHIHRYEEAARLLQGKSCTLLDIACGTGFGSNYLASKGHTVVGGDISEEAIKECVANYQAGNLSYKVLDGLNLPYDNEHFDALISFETIEHTTSYKRMLEEFRRVVKKDGILIISTPNFLVNSPKGVIVNPYHTQEWRYGELRELLTSVFGDVNIQGQKYSRYDTMQGLRYNMGNAMEEVLYMRGVRKLPISFQDSIMKALIGKPMYPTKDDYTLVNDLPSIEKCKTFFAVCKG
jgi:2-polyprenyl-3-methyl-5-hydroxy-6-metoxy-1,4-benzoquinol methylase